jgi:CRISPR-associated endonuclease/helicase Cas3
MIQIDFAKHFERLTGNPPFPWQERLFDRLQSYNLPSAVSLPTGLGKTSIIAVWLLALAHNPKCVARRLVYVVNRRTVVDQTTTEVEHYRRRLQSPDLADVAGALRDLWATAEDGVCPLAASTLRGELADNREWSVDPTRPSVICGTVDMIGSRLLFSGYGVGWKARPLHAGFLGQDTLVVHDEAHLEQPFQHLLEAIEAEQAVKERTGELSWPKMRVLPLTATPRSDGRDDIVIEADDLDHPVIKARIHAVKNLHLSRVKDSKQLSLGLAKAALRWKHAACRVLIFCRRVDDVVAVQNHLRKEGVDDERVAMLTGTIRGFERDRLFDGKHPVGPCFLPPPQGRAAEETVYLICTSAGEVGVNISADHLVCDLTPFDSMAQRFGRVNRFGTSQDSEITVICPESVDSDSEYEVRCQRTWALLNQLNGSANPSALGDLDPQQRSEAFTPTPVILPTSEILFDAWSLTSIRGKLPGRPPVEPYLHGIADWSPPETVVAWRQEVEVLTPDVLESLSAADLLDDYEILARESLRDQSARVLKWIKELAKKRRSEDVRVWLVDPTGEVDTGKSLADLARLDEEEIAGSTVLLPPSAGGLSPLTGMLDSEAPFTEDVSGDEIATDVNDPRMARPRIGRCRIFDKESSDAAVHLIRQIAIPDSLIDDEEQSEDSEHFQDWRWYRAVQEGDRTSRSRRAVTLERHVAGVVEHMSRFVTATNLTAELRDALLLAAMWHDSGKRRQLFQVALGNFEPGTFWAKSGGQRLLGVDEYRHELGSLIDVLYPTEADRIAFGESFEQFERMNSETRDVVLHVIAAHHGWARPHFAPERCFDPERAEAAELSLEIPRRFARLQRTFGRWGLAYLESLLRAADWAASEQPEKYTTVKS